MALPPFIEEHLQLFVCGAIAVVGLVIYGFRDLLRFSIGRVWAISSVCFAESVRRKIWLITPLAILGVIVVSQLQNPTDERDAIRQTIKFSLFATGLLVTVTAIILACTNLPREIENRVIFTIVTKPTTRMEIVVGKVLGFARVSALILLIMGLFTWGYLHLRTLNFEHGIRDRLAAGDVDEVSKPTLEYYLNSGLLSARQMAFADDLEVYNRLPGARGRRYMPPGGEGHILIPFEVRPADLVPVGLTPGPDALPGSQGLSLLVWIGAESRSGISPFVAAPSTKPATTPSTAPANLLQIQVHVLDSNLSLLIPPKDLSGGGAIAVADATGQTPTQIVIPPSGAVSMYKPGTDINKPMRFYVQIDGSTPDTEYFLDSEPIVKENSPNYRPVALVVPWLEGQQPRVIRPMRSPIFQGREGTAGQQIRGASNGKAPLAVYTFNNAAPVDTSGNVAFEFRSGIERSAADSDSDESVTQALITVHNRDTGEESPPITLALESNRQSYFSVPAKYVASGNFDLLVRGKSNGHYLGLFPTSASMVRATQGFDFNLFKSLLIMWLMAILVITIAIFTSVFVSWPTAIVLTLVILLGRWGVEQLGDATQPGIGNMIATDMGFTDPGKARVVSSVAEGLASGLNALAKILPDISQFAATEDIERGMVVPPAKVWAGMQVLLSYGLAVLALAYVRLTWLEVAP